MSRQLALLGGTPVRTRPFTSWPIFGKAEEKRLLRTLRSGRWGKLDGTEVAEFENRFGTRHGCQHAVGVVNGTVSLRIALQAAGLRAEDEVIVPSYTFFSTASAVIEANAVPVFADVELDTFNLEPKAVEAAITPRTRAIIPVHFAGQPADMDRHMASFSFQSSKNLTAGEGGIITTNDDALAESCRSIHNCGRIPTGVWYEHHVISGNYRLGEFQAAVLNSQLDRLEQQTRTRDRNGQYLSARIATLPGLHPQKRPAACTRHSYHLFMLRVDGNAFGAPRAAVIKALQAEGIPCSGGYGYSLHHQPMFQKKAFGPFLQKAAARLDYGQTNCPNSDLICREQCVWLEQKLFLGPRADMDDIARAFEKIYEYREALSNWSRNS